MWQIPSLKAIAILPASMLSADSRIIYRTGAPVAVIAQPEKIQIIGKAYLKSDTDSSDPFAGTAELSFTTYAPEETNGPKAYIAVDHQDRYFLIGAFEPPFPKIKQSEYTGASPSDTNLTTVTVTWSHPPIPCIAVI